MYKIQAEKIYIGDGRVIEKGGLIADDSGKILDIFEKKPDYSLTDVLKLEGSLSPGLINPHCHLELSYLKNKIKKRSSLGNFLEQMIQVKNEPVNEVLISESIEKAIEESKRNGIVAIGDICNGTSSLAAKKKHSEVKYINFIEVYGLNKAQNKTIIDRHKNLFSGLLSTGKCYFSPHSFYALNTDLLFQLETLYSDIVSIHHYESQDEIDFLENRSGNIQKTYETLNINYQGVSHNTSIPFIERMKNKNILLVHNKNLPPVFFEKTKPLKHLYFCFCPSSNLFIENELPKFSPSISERFCIGTDSLATNNTLDIIKEMKILYNNSKHITFAKLIQGGTLNAARVLKIDNQFGSFEVGKRPGAIEVQNLESGKQNHRIRNIF